MDQRSHGERRILEKGGHRGPEFYTCEGAEGPYHCREVHSGPYPGRSAVLPDDAGGGHLLVGRRHLSAGARPTKGEHTGPRNCREDEVEEAHRSSPPHADRTPRQEATGRV